MYLFFVVVVVCKCFDLCDVSVLYNILITIVKKMQGSVMA